MDVPHRPAAEAALYRLSKRWWRLTGRLPEAVRTPLVAEGRPVFMIHNPKCAGSSLKGLLGVRATRTTHSWPRDLFRPALWEEGVFVVAVRHPFERFLSSWRYHCRSGYAGKLVRRHGDLSRLSPQDYFDFIAQYPENCGPQVHWVDYPSARKPEADVVLRVEDSASWPEQLRARGIMPVMNLAPRLNTSPRGEGAGPAEMGLREDALDRLRARVEARYRDDYLRFGYAFGARN